MATPTLDLRTLDPTVEIIVRAGDIKAANARDTFQQNYVGTDAAHPDVVGLSVVLHPGYSYYDLAQRNHFRHRKLSYNTVAALVDGLRQAGYDLLLYITPDLPNFPDHHSLAVVRNGQRVDALPDEAADALIRVLWANPVDNPFPTK